MSEITPRPEATPEQAQAAAEMQVKAAFILIGIAGIAWLPGELLYVLRRIVGWDDAPVPAHETAEKLARAAVEALNRANDLQNLATRLRAARADES